MRWLTAIAAAVLLLTGCGAAERQRTAAGFNDADAAFATAMLRQHADGLAMVDDLRGHEVDPRLTEIGSAAVEAQGPEIEQLTTWLEDWEQPVPETSRDHANAHDEEGGDGDTSDARFAEQWITDRIDLLEKSVQIAETEVEQGQHHGAVKMARSIIKAHQAEIRQLDEIRGV